MLVSSRACSMTSFIFLDLLIYMLNPTGCPPVGCPEACTCQENDAGAVNLTCTEPDTLESVPEIAAEYAKTVVTMIIKNQPRLASIEPQSLQSFSSLWHLQVESTGLVHLADEAFQSMPELKILLLRENCIQCLPVQLLHPMDGRKLWLQGNPLLCNCSNAWLQNTPQLVDAGDVTCVVTPSESDAVCHRNKYARKSDSKSLGMSYSNIGQGQDLIAATELAACGSPCVCADNDIVEVRKGSDLNITCRKCNTVIAVEITWQAKDLHSNWTELSSGMDHSQHVLQIQNLQAEDHYKVVTCIWNHTYGSNTSCIRIVVPSPPTIVIFVDLNIYYQEMTIVYSIACWPRPQLKWLKYGEMLHFNHLISSSEMTINSSGIFTGFLLFDPIGPSTDGLYTLVATNSEGSANRTINITEFVNVLSVHSDYLPEMQNTVKTLTNMPVDDHFLRSASAIEIFLAVTAGILITVLILAISACICQKLKLPSLMSSQRSHIPSHLNRKHLSSNEDLPLTSIHLIDNPYYNGKTNKNRSATKLCIKTVKLETIFLIRSIGQGAFGQVFLAGCANLINKDEFTTVAVKTLKGECSDLLKGDLKREAEILASFEHQNIITFYGLCTESEQWMMIFEFMEDGDLNNYIRNHSPDAALLPRGDPSPVSENPLTTIQLLQIAVQIASGMEYLASQHFVHRDLATRNCLVNSGLVVKIGDFGMSRDVYSTDYYKVGGEAVMLPIRWMPRESILYRTFTVESDVWSFGVTLWEVFTYGKQPWYEYSNHEVIEHIKYFHLLTRPPKCPEPVHKVMLGCWKVHPQDRLSMKEIFGLLNEDLFTNQHEYLEIIA